MVLTPTRLEPLLPDKGIRLINESFVVNQIHRCSILRCRYHSRVVLSKSFFEVACTTNVEFTVLLAATYIYVVHNEKFGGLTETPIAHSRPHIQPVVGLASLVTDTIAGQLQIGLL